MLKPISFTKAYAKSLARQQVKQFNSHSKALLNLLQVLTADKASTSLLFNSLKIIGMTSPNDIVEQVFKEKNKIIDNACYNTWRQLLTSPAIAPIYDSVLFEYQRRDFKYKKWTNQFGIEKVQPFLEKVLSKQYIQDLLSAELHCMRKLIKHNVAVVNFKGDSIIITKSQEEKSYEFHCLSFIHVGQSWAIVLAFYGFISLDEYQLVRQKNNNELMKNFSFEKIDFHTHATITEHSIEPHTIKITFKGDNALKDIKALSKLFNA